MEEIMNMGCQFRSNCTVKINFLNKMWIVAQFVVDCYKMYQKNNKNIQKECKSYPP